MVEFHVHIDDFGIELGEISTQLGEGSLDHPIYFASKNLSQEEHNYTTMEIEDLAIVYAL